MGFAHPYIIIRKLYIHHFLPTYFLLPEKKVSKETWHKGGIPLMYPLSARKTQPTRPSVSRLQTLLAKGKNILKIIALAFPTPSVLSRPLLDPNAWSGQKGGELAGIGASEGCFWVGASTAGFLARSPKWFFVTFLPSKK
jgi:hypothetical protein